MRKFLIGAAAIALAASAAHSDPGNGKGGGKGGDKGGGQSAAGPVNPGGGKDKAKVAKADHGQTMKAAKADRGPEMRADKADAREWKSGKDRGEAKRDVQIERRVDRDVRVIDRDRDDRRFARDGNRGLIDGCPPGLAKKNNGCLPPGQAKKRDGYRDANYRPSWFGYSSLGDGRYTYDDGYLYRMSDNGSVLGFVPLLGGALSVGNQWPSYYQPNAVPDYYVDYYNLGAQDSYRYADDVLYRVDPQSSAITGIAALLTGDQFNVGQQLPMGYDVYNVPFAYQDRYTDSTDAAYRYSDGYVYEVDPQTQLISAVIELLT